MLERLDVFLSLNTSSSGVLEPPVTQTSSACSSPAAGPPPSGVGPPSTCVSYKSKIQHNNMSSQSFKQGTHNVKHNVNFSKFSAARPFRGRLCPSAQKCSQQGPLPVERQGACSPPSPESQLSVTGVCSAPAFTSCSPMPGILGMWPCVCPVLSEPAQQLLVRGSVVAVPASAPGWFTLSKYLCLSGPHCPHLTVIVKRNGDALSSSETLHPVQEPPVSLPFLFPLLETQGVFSHTRAERTWWSSLCTGETSCHVVRGSHVQDLRVACWS